MVSLKLYDRKANMPMRFRKECTSENTKAFTEIHAIHRKNFPIRYSSIFIVTLNDK